MTGWFPIPSCLNCRWTNLQTGPQKTLRSWSRWPAACHSMPQYATACHCMPQHAAAWQLPYRFHFHCEKMTLSFPSGACFHSSTINFIKFPWAGFTIFKADMHDSSWCLWMFHLSEQVWCQISSASGLCRVRHRLATGCKPCRWLQSWGVRRAMEALERPGTTHIGGSHWPSSVGRVGEPVGSAKEVFETSWHWAVVRYRRS